MRGILSRLGYSPDNDISLITEKLYITLAGLTLDTETQRVVASLLSEYVAGHLDELPESVTWLPFEQGLVCSGDTVRVRPDAYESELGNKHNGLAGTVSAIRGGRVIVKYFGREDGIGVTHHPDALERMQK